MRLLHVTPYYAPAYAFGGVTRAVEGLAEALAAAGHAVTVLTTDAGTQTTRLAQPAEELRRGVRVIRVANLSVWARGRLNLSTPLAMGGAVRRLLAEVDLVHCHEFRTLENLLVTPGAARAGLPLVVSPHGTLPIATGRGGFKALWDRLFSPMLARRFHAVAGLTASETASAEAAWMRFAPPPARPPVFATIPNGVDWASFADMPDGNAFRLRYGLGDAPVILFLGRLHPRKGAAVLARAFLTANVPGARLVIAGPDDGALSALRPLIDGEERIILTGYLDADERLQALAAADLFALPAVGEGLSLAVLEAMAAGCPVILSPGCHLPEAAEHDAGLIVEPEVEPLAAALWLLLTDPMRRRAMGVQARALAREHFTWDRAAEAFTALYRRLTGISA